MPKPNETAEPMVPRQRGRAHQDRDHTHGGGGPRNLRVTRHIAAAGGSTLLSTALSPADPVEAKDTIAGRAVHGRPAWERANFRAKLIMLIGALDHWARNHRPLLIDAGAVALAALDVVLVVPHDASVTTSVLSGVSCLALVLRRRFPFLVTLAVIPGYIWGWAELAAMIALGSLAWRKGLGWQTILGAVGVWAGTFILFPISVFTGEDWHHHVLDAMYGCVFAIGPMALGLLINARRDLSARVDELAASREREERLMSAAVRADERAKLAREMHDLVSHQVSLIAMQAGALQVSTEDTEARDTAATIRKLSVKTLDELRQLVGTLRTAVDDADEIGLDGLADLVHESAVQADLSLNLGGRKPTGPVANAVYRTVQEALTNVRKHAEQAHTSVAILADDDHLDVEVRNDAPPVPASVGRATMRPLPSGGHGLLGLRERAELLGGSFEAGPVGRGGFLVRASFPLRRSSDWA